MFETNENILLLDKMENESNTFYYTKCNFLRNCDLKKYTIDYLIKMANVYTNNKLYGCEYSLQTMNELKKIIS